MKIKKFEHSRNFLILFFILDSTFCYSIPKNKILTDLILEQEEEDELFDSESERSLSDISFNEEGEDIQDVFDDSPLEEEKHDYHSIQRGSDSDDSEEDSIHVPVFGPNTENRLPNITLSDPDVYIPLDEPNENVRNEILHNLYSAKGQCIEDMKNYVVGIKGQERLLTLDEAMDRGLLSPSGAGAILYRVKSFKDGESSTIQMKFGLRRGEDIVIGRYPASLIARPYGNEAFHPNDPSLAPLTKWLELMGHLTWINPLASGSGPAVNPTNAYGYSFSLSSMAAGISANYFSEEHQRSLSGGLNTSGRGTGASAGITDGQASHSLWFNILNGWTGLGYTSLYNMEEQQLGLSALGVGTFVAGWKSYVQFGASLNAVFANGNQVGTGGVITLSKDRITSYLHKYEGNFDGLVDDFVAQYSLQRNFFKNELKVTRRLLELLKLANNGERVKYMDDEVNRLEHEIKSVDYTIEKFLAEKNYFRNKHFIEVIDTDSKGFRLQGGAFASGVGMGFRAGVSKGSKSIHRFYTHLDRAKELLKDGSGDKIALLRVPEKFDTKKFPDILKPHKWHMGEEVITTVEKTFNGSIVMGVHSIPGLDAKVGISGTVSGSFEVGIRKLPANKLEVTLRPEEITELGAFISTINAVGPQLSQASTIALAMRQTFVFDLDNQKAVDTYMLFMNGGVLPLDFSITANIVGRREAENLLDIAIIQREALGKKGILLTYLEKIDVPAKKFYAGVAKVPCIDSKHWAGLSYEYLHGQAKVISTNADIAVSRETKHVQTEISQGRNGTRTNGAYATVKRIFIKSSKEDQNMVDGDEYPNDDGYIWRFKGVILRARISDDKITGKQHNQIIDQINSMFHANVSHFPKQSKGHKQSRDILLERELTSRDLDMFSEIKQMTIETAARASGIGKPVLTNLISELEDKGHNEMANILIKFVGKHGLHGVSAVHLMLDGSCRNLIIRTESNAYIDPLEYANRLEALYTNSKADERGIRYLDIGYNSRDAHINDVYKNIRSAIYDIDAALIDLDEDPLFEGADDLLTFGDTNLREKKINLRSKLLAAKNRLLDLIDLEKQEFPDDAILKIYRAIPEKKRDINQRYTLLAERYKRQINLTDPRKEITNRWHIINQLIDDIANERQKLESEHQRRVLGNVYADKRINQLDTLERRSRRLISMNHLKNDAKKFVKKITKHRFFGLFPAKPVHHNIAGHMEHATSGHLEESNEHRQDDLLRMIMQCNRPER
ncbi:MAG: hypothetical protein AB8G05_14245 [Oligoflexales bacterium]